MERFINSIYGEISPYDIANITPIVVYLESIPHLFEVVRKVKSKNLIVLDRVMDILDRYLQMYDVAYLHFDTYPVDVIRKMMPFYNQHFSVVEILRANIEKYVSTYRDDILKYPIITTIIYEGNYYEHFPLIHEDDLPALIAKERADFKRLMKEVEISRSRIKCLDDQIKLRKS